MSEKGGCKVGKKGSELGGCKEGKKKINFIVHKPERAKKKSQQPAQQAKVIAPKKRVAKTAKVMASKKENISKITEKDLEIYEIAGDDEDSNWWDSVLHFEDFSGIMTQGQGKWFIKARLKGYGNLSEKDQNKFEDLEEKSSVGVQREVSKHHTKMFKKWKVDNKGMTATLKEFKKSFEKFYHS